MEAWVPLFDIFLNSPTPESEASLWFQQSFDAINATSTNSFLSLLSKPVDVVVVDSSSSSSTTPSSSSHSKRVMYIQTLPNVVQSRILCFLMVESQRFCDGDLSKLANSILKGDKVLDFWVKKAAYNLFDAVSDSDFNWISSLSLGSSEERIEEKFEALPSWLESTTSSSTTALLPWLPISYDELKSSTFVGSFVEEISDEDEMEEDKGGGRDEESNQMDVDIETARPVDVTIDSEIQKEAAILKAQLVTFESASKTIGLANGILQLCFDKAGGGGRNSLVILGLIEPWEADDENASILISNLSGGCGSEQEDSSWPSNVLCSVILPKLLVLSKPASRVLVTSTIEFCKLHQKAAVDALLFPLIFRKEGMNTPICDVVTRIIRECLHIAHAAAFCQKVLCGEKEQRKFMCLPCHQCLISHDLVWTEPLFTLFQNILNKNVYLSQDSVDCLVSSVHELADRYPKSLKFGNFLLCLVTKCHTLLKSHKLLLIESVKRTNTFMTKSILSKLDGL